MKDQSTAAPAVDTSQQIITQILNAWKQQNKAVSNYLTKYDDAAYSKEVAAGRNSAIYLLGHLIAANDSMLPLFGLGDRTFPELHETFQLSPDKKDGVANFAELKQNWETVVAKLTDEFGKLTPEQWLDRHTSVSPEDFANEPLRNRLNALIGRTNHQAYHLGQMNLLYA